MKKTVKRIVKTVVYTLHLNNNKTLRKVYHKLKLYKSKIDGSQALFRVPQVPPFSLSKPLSSKCDKSIKFVNKNLCTGCACCYNICPHDAIEMPMDSEGFWTPVVNEEKCVNCGLCIERCPIDNLQAANLENPECFALIAKDSAIREKSSSGGFFGVLSEYVRSRGGYVLGPAFRDGLHLQHVSIAPAESLAPLRGSKYLQSHVGMTMRQAKKLLDDGQWVLFTGTPCQVAGFNNYLNKKYDKLLTAEVMCHGGSSPGAFKKYIKENFPDKHFINYFFRAKYLLNWGHSEILATENNELVGRLKNESDYFKMFNDCISTRVSCGSCQASSLPRQADYTLADAWLIWQISPELNDGHGTSLISVNNERAKKILAELWEQFAKCKPVPLEWVLTHGQPMNHAFKPVSPKHKRFFDLLESNTFKRAKSYTLENKFDVAILGVWFGGNYGSVITYYSLYCFLRELGLLVLMVEKPIKGIKDPEHNPAFHARKFAAKYYGDRISRFYTPETIWRLNRHVDTFLLGSDQVFHRNLINYFRHVFLLNFVEDSKKKIAFGASFGHATDSNPPEKRREIASLLKRFDHIGMREKSGVQILRDNYGIYNSTTVLDPIFLHDNDFFANLAYESSREVDKNYILAYILDPTSEIGNSLKVLSDKLGLRIVLIPDGFIRDLRKSAYTQMGIIPEKNIEVEDWIKYFMNASYIVTDSYHGLCLSIIFKKLFLILANKKRGTTRFENLLTITDLNHRLVMKADGIEDVSKLIGKIDYEAVDKRLSKKIVETKAWLNNALFSPKIIKNEAKWNLVVENEDFSSQQDVYVTMPNSQENLQFCKNIDEYLEKLVIYKSKYTILISIKGGPGKYLTEKMQDNLYKIGINSELYGKLLNSFLGIIDGGISKYDYSVENERISYSGEISENSILMDSAPDNHGNIANIIIDGINYSLNKRGFNFVIMDKGTNQIIDIVSFDTHVPQPFCFRVQ